MPFDILTDSAIDIARGLVDQAWGGKAPEGGLDFPSACVLSKTDDFGSDLHLELGVTQDTEELSDIGWLADVTHTDVQGPHDTDSPFKYQAGEINPPGLFGKALKAYGQVIALCNEYHVPTAGYDSWFREQWGVHPDEDLSDAVPVVRSHGDALWGGIKRKLAPSAYAHAAASKQMRVMWHGSQRKDIGEHRLVDWPRLTAIAQLAGASLMVEDRFAGKGLKRIDYKLVRREFPVAPTTIGEDIGSIPVRKGWVTRDISRAALEHVRGFRKHALILARGGLGASGSLSIDDSVNIPSDALVRFIRQGQTPGVPMLNLLNDGGGVFDITDTDHKPSLKVEGGDKMNVYNAFAAVIRPYVDKHISKIPLAWQIRTAATGLAIGASKVDDKREIHDLVELVVPDDFLLRVYRLYTIINRSKEKGGEVISNLLKAFDAPRSAFETRDWLAIGRRVKNSPQCQQWFAEEIARAVSRHRVEHGEQTKLVGSIRRILSAEHTGDIALAELVRKRKNWWAGDYRRKAKKHEKRQVEYQVKSKLFRHTKLHVDDSGTVTVDFKHPGLIMALKSAARAYIRKRKGVRKSDDEAPESGHLDPIAYVHKLDRVLQPDVKFLVGWNSYVRSIEFLVEDVEKVLAFVADAMQNAAIQPGGELESDGESDSGTESDYGEEEEQVPENAHDMEEAEEDAGDVFGDEDLEEEMLDFDEEDEDVGLFEEEKGLIDLAAELHEDLPHLKDQEVLEATLRYGTRVGASAYKAIMEEVHQLHLAKARKVKPDFDPETHDIRDRREQ